MRMLWPIWTLSLCLVSPCRADEVSALAQRGQEIVNEFCAPCHAVGSAGESPHAGAPAFRHLDRRLDLDTLSERLTEGLTSHHDMPAFRFTRDDARAVAAYVRAIQGP